VIQRSRLLPSKDAGGWLAVAVAAFAVALAACGLWLATGVHVDEIARFLPYELGFVFLPGWLTYRAVVIPPGGRLRQIAIGWSLGYLLEIGAFFVTAAAGVRSVFYVYPVVVGVPAALVARRRRNAASTHSESHRLPRISRLSVCLAALLCMLLLCFAAAAGFSQTPLPRDVTSATYQEDTVFTISIAAEALHHWPVTLPMVAGQPLHYHLFAFMHMAAISQVTGIDLSVVVMRLYEVPLLVLFALQLILLGRNVGRRLSVGFLAAFLVLFTGELDSAWSGLRYQFFDLLFIWLLGSHTLLMGMIFFIPAVTLLAELVSAPAISGRTALPRWLLVLAFLIGCTGAKSYSLLTLGSALGIFLLWRLWRNRELNRPALLAFCLTSAIYVAANTLVFRWNSGGISTRPFLTFASMPGVGELDAYLSRIWGSGTAPRAVGVAYGMFGLLGVTLVGIGLLLMYRRALLSASEAWLFSLFLAALPPLVLLSQPGLGQMFLVVFGVVPGTVLAAVGLTEFWERRTLHARMPTALALAGGAGAASVLALLSDNSPRVGMQVSLVWFVLVLACAALARMRVTSPTLVSTTVGVGLAGLLLLDTPIVSLVRNGVDGRWVELGATIAALLGALVLAQRLGGRPVAVGGLVNAAVAATIVLGVLNTPLDWFPHLIDRTADGKPPYDQSFRGLTAGLYDGLLWIRNNSNTNAVLVVNNHSLTPDNRDSKYFYYSAFAQRRVVLESWDYTPQAAASGLFSLDAQHTPFFRRLTLSQAVFRTADENAIRTLRRGYHARYLVVDKVHGQGAPNLATQAQHVFGNGDIDVYDAAGPVAPQTPGPRSCPTEQTLGINVVFGHRRSLDKAIALRDRAVAHGFQGLTVERRGCSDYAVVLTGLDDLAQAESVERHATSFRVHLECRSHRPDGGLNAVFGHRRTRWAAEILAGRAGAVGFTGLEVRQDRCGDWEVDLAGLGTGSQREEFRQEAARVGFRIRFEPG
jgi:hypothetical protein